MRLTAPAKLILSVLLMGASALATGSADARPIKNAKPAAASPPAPPTRNPDGSLRAPSIDDAPKDDYQRVAWCHGVLKGDMELAEIVDSVLPVDKDIQAIGQSYLRSYEAALTLSGKGATPATHLLAEKARQTGYDSWSVIREAPIPQAANAYVTWQLPGDCEHAAVRLSGHPNLFAEMSTDAELDATERALKSGGPHNYNELPKPVLAAQAAPADPNAPISTNTLARRAQQSAALPPVSSAPVSSAPVNSAPVTTAPATEAPATAPAKTETPVNKTTKPKGLLQSLGWGKKKD